MVKPIAPKQLQAMNNINNYRPHLQQRKQGSSYHDLIYIYISVSM